MSQDYPFSNGTSSSARSRPFFTQHLRDTQSDLAHRWRRHSDTIKTTWRSLSRNQRVKCVLAVARGRSTPNRASDVSIGTIHQLMPEWNLNDLVADAEYLINHLSHRATSSLHHQVLMGCGGQPGDRLYVHDMMNRGVSAQAPLQGEFMFFPDSKDYGISREVAEHELALALWASDLATSICVPTLLGDLILSRQQCFVGDLKSITAEILSLGPETEYAEKRTLPCVRLNARLKHTGGSSELTDFVQGARHQKEDIDKHLELLACVFNVVQNLIKGATIWEYVGHLFRELQRVGTESICRPVLLQELSNCCMLEWARLQTVLKRFIYQGFGIGHFQRKSDTFDQLGNPIIVFKKDPMEIINSDSERYLLFHLAQSSQNPADVIYFLGYLAGLWQQKPKTSTFLYNPRDHENKAFHEFVSASHYVKRLSELLDLPPPSSTEGCFFASKYHTLEIDFLNSLKRDKFIDLRDSCGPIAVLLRTGMAKGCLNKLDELVTDRMGTTIRGLYEDVLRDSISDLDAHCEQSRVSFRQKTTSMPLSSPMSPEESTRRRDTKSERSYGIDRMFCNSASPAETAESPSMQHQLLNDEEDHPAANESSKRPNRKKRSDCRTIHTSPDALRGDDKNHVARNVVREGDALGNMTFKVKSSTAEFFWALFSKSKARPSTSWKSFEAAMADLGFSVMRNKGGSSVAFIPPEDLPKLRPVTIHAPHHFQIEGYRSLILSRRLTRAYGWDENTFRVY
ncbi:ipa protein [Colletotrichum kahawae]|uniref:Ipa protein n=1 Tax=Colletotrichum kahawae TaxID=34407 RepID=A0AAD9Y0N4_COLKA|nr:ipa protein [Colletotrichum kahawae]